MKYERFGKIEVVKASKEVILSAGAIGSPKILLLSGVGPEQELNELKVRNSKTILIIIYKLFVVNFFLFLFVKIDSCSSKSTSRAKSSGKSFCA